MALVRCSVYTGILLFVAVSPVPQAGVRPFIVLSCRYRLSNYRIFQYDTIVLLWNDNIETFDTISNTISNWDELAVGLIVEFD